MPVTRWNSFPAIDPKKWRTAVGDSISPSNASWERPIWSPEDATFEFPSRRIADPSEGNPWQLQERIHSEDQVLDSLLNGVAGLRLDASDCDMTWFDGVHMNMVELHVEPKLFHANKLDVHALLEAGWRGSCPLDITPAVGSAQMNDHWRMLDKAPHLRIWRFGESDHRLRGLNLKEALVEHCLMLDHWLKWAKASDAIVEEELNRMVWRWWTSVDVMEEVAGLRALRALWSRWLAANQLDDRAVWIDAVTSDVTFRDELETDHLIDLTVASYAAIIGGADGLETVPHMKSKSEVPPGENALRWARNIQHLMREEAGLHRTFDPMGGSRTVDRWSSNLLEAAWSAYLESKL